MFHSEDMVTPGLPVQMGCAAPVQYSMKDSIISIIKEAVAEIAGAGEDVTVSVPEDSRLGHYTTNYALQAAKAHGEKPIDLARDLAEKILQKAPAGFFERVEAALPGFVNFWLAPGTVQHEFARVAGDAAYGTSKDLDGKMVMVEFTDANPFKLFHIGHLMSNTIGESIARLYEAGGAKVRRANYFGDVCLHIAMSVWGMDQLAAEMPGDDADLNKKMAFLGKAYAYGSREYKENATNASTITLINKNLYERSDERLNALYDKGLAWSLAYFETAYRRLGTKFDDYFPESTVAHLGAEVVRSHMDVFAESDHAIIFPGEKYGLHTRVFISSQGLPVYEAKELGLNKKKFDLYPLDLSIVVTGNEIVDYFKVLLKAMELTMPNVGARTRHISHGMLRLPTGKMSSRTGDVVTAESLIGEAKARLEGKVSEKSGLTEAEHAEVVEGVAIGAIKYSILKQNPGQDIVFDFEHSLSFEGDSGPYVQYSYARLKSILRKATETGQSIEVGFASLDSEPELSLMRKIFAFPETLAHARERFAPSALVNYLYKLAVAANKFYETTPILKEEDSARRAARLQLADVAARTIGKGITLLGMRPLEKI